MENLPVRMGRRKLGPKRRTPEENHLLNRKSPSVIPLSQLPQNQAGTSTFEWNYAIRETQKNS
jgi:hypothetical protein